MIDKLLNDLEIIKRYGLFIDAQTVTEDTFDRDTKESLSLFQMQPIEEQALPCNPLQRLDH